jgi:signal transduction histidine kinase
MLKSLTIRQRILLTFLATVLIGGLVQLIIAGRQLQLATLEFYQHHLETDALMIAATLSEPLEHYLDGEGTQELQRILGNIQGETVHDYLIVDSGYHVVGFTAGIGYETVERVSQTPELTEAAHGSIGADIRNGHDGTEHLYVAVSMLYEGRNIGFLVLSRLMQPAYDEVMRQWLQLGSATLPVVLTAVIASLWLSATISRPVQQLRNSALKMARGELDTRIAITTQQDEVGQLARSFNYMAEQLEGLMKTQRSFVSNAAHELRTPLMTLKLRVEALEDDALPSDDRIQYMREIQQEINHMAELVSSLLVLARIDEGRHQRNGSVTDTASTLHDIARHWRITAKQAGLACDSQIPNDLPDLPLTSNDLRQVLDNLLSNAIKYTAKGEVSLVVEQCLGQVAMRVHDTGIGFTPEQSTQLFTRFYRSDQVRSNFDGNGLGLSIVQAILQQYGASITAESDGVGKGATFTVTIPI